SISTINTFLYQSCSFRVAVRISLTVYHSGAFVLKIPPHPPLPKGGSFVKGFLFIHTILGRTILYTEFYFI
ncbi:MAG: hypothetical protein Q8K51_14350, partial [Nitrospirota bacterium]|nr:hypothetical protein [Nitrospirota bacterium]